MVSRALSLGRTGRARGLLQSLGTLIIVGLLAYVIYQNRTEFQQASFFLDYTLVGICFALWFVSYLLFALGWHLVLRTLGSAVSWWSDSRVWFLSQGLKYIPGSVAQVAGRVYMAREEGVPGVPAALAIAIESLVAVASALLVFVALFPLGLGDLPMPLIIASLAVVICMVMCLPLLVQRIAALISRQVIVSVDFKALVITGGYYIGTWLVAGLACYVGFRSLGESFSLAPLQVIGMYTLSWAAGYVAIFAPGGFGVRDGILILLMSRFVPLPVATLGAVVVRVETLSVEGVLALLASKLWPVLESCKTDRFEH